MDFELIDLEVAVSDRRIAHALVRYYRMFIRCDLVYYPPLEKVWIRLPEFWVNKAKVRHCYWARQEVSEDFQERILNEVYSKYELSLEKVKELHQSYKIKKKMDSVY